MRSWGFIEVVGYIPAVAAADAMVKAAGVTLAGCEVIGGGYVTVAVTGEIGAIRTAVDAGRPPPSRRAAALRPRHQPPRRCGQGGGLNFGRQGIRRSTNGLLRIYRSRGPGAPPLRRLTPP